MLGYGYASGNILLDPAVPLRDFNARLNTFVPAYARSISIFGMSGKLDVVVPFTNADWSGINNGDYEEASRTGFGNLRVRFSVNFLGVSVAVPIKMTHTIK